MAKIIVDGITYIPETEAKKEGVSLKGMKYCVVRTYSAGVFAGYVVNKIGQSVTMKNARRLWYWDGAASLSQLAMEGVTKPENCKFPCEVDEIILEQVIEVISATKKAKDSILAVE